MAWMEIIMINSCVRIVCVLLTVATRHMRMYKPTINVYAIGMMYACTCRELSIPPPLKLFGIPPTPAPTGGVKSPYTPDGAHIILRGLLQ